VRKLLAVLLVCLAVLGGSAAHAARQLRADDEPAVEPPLYQSDKQCDDQTLKSGRKPVIRVAFCVFFYTFDSLSELDLNNDYGVVWAQASFDALPGFCTSELSFYVDVSPGTRIHQRTPSKAVTAKRTTAMDVEIAATAGGNAIDDGLISQRFQLLPGLMKPIGSGEAPRVGVSWKGRTPAKVAFATGAEISWPMLAPPPTMRLGADTIRLTSGPGC
jgi:hypothetical protein